MKLFSRKYLLHNVLCCILFDWNLLRNNIPENNSAKLILVQTIL